MCKANWGSGGVFLLALVSALALAGGCGQAGLAGTGTAPAASRPAPPPVVFTFDDQPVGRFPLDWEVVINNSSGPAARWQVVEDPAAPSKPRVLKITEIRDGAKQVFNFCLPTKPVFRDGAIEVKVRADTGKIDQGGGLVWRVRDIHNYYLARYNPLEKNLRLYFVKDNKRTLIAGVPDVTIPAGQWFTLGVTHRGRKIDLYLDGRHVLEAQDETFPAAGGVGLWTKADAASSFDDLKIQGE